MFIIFLLIVIIVHVYIGLLSSTATTLQQTVIQTTSTPMNCIPYTVPDSRPFFERDFPQVNVPQRISNKSNEDLLRSLRLLILATACNVEKYIDKFRKSTEAILDLFHPSSRILICESDSSDKTVDKLLKWSRAQLYTYGHMSSIYPARSERIAFCRNKLLNVSREITADYLLMTDLDVFASKIPAFISSFRYNTDQWAAMTASSGIYYDIWALRTLSDSVMNFDVWHRISKIQSEEKSYCSQSVTDQIIGNHQKLIPVHRGLVEVRSAFNGAGLYKANLTYGCTYSGANTTCEHVPFHQCIREKNHGRIFINPEFLVN